VEHPQAGGIGGSRRRHPPVVPRDGSGVAPGRGHDRPAPITGSDGVDRARTVQRSVGRPVRTTAGRSGLSPAATGTSGRPAPTRRRSVGACGRRTAVGRHRRRPVDAGIEPPDRPFSQVPNAGAGYPGVPGRLAAVLRARQHRQRPGFGLGNRRPGTGGDPLGPALSYSASVSPPGTGSRGRFAGRTRCRSPDRTAAGRRARHRRRCCRRSPSTAPSAGYGSRLPFPPSPPRRAGPADRNPFPADRSRP